MSLLGKVLIVLNLLAAAAFTYVTLDNYGKRQALTSAAVVRHIQLHGLPVEPSPKPDGLDDDRVALAFELDNRPYDTVRKKTLDEAIPRGDDIFGGEPVSSQTDEVNRVKAKVLAHIAAQGAATAQWQRAYLLAIARTGAERDGINAIFDMRDPARAPAARRDLPLVARTAAQTAALRALVDVSSLNDPAFGDVGRESRIAQAREAVKQFALSQVPHGAAAGGDRAEAERRLTNAILNAFLLGAGPQQQAAIKSAADGDQAGFEQIAAAAVEPLTDQASVGRASAALLAYATGKKATEAEVAALTAVRALIDIPSGLQPAQQQQAADPNINTAATQLLTAKFDEAALPAAAKAGATGDPVGAKARQIAHLLYHIDGWRYATPAMAAARKDWHTRVAAVIGMPAYVRAAEAQASEYAEAAQRLVTVITEEQSEFEARYQAAVQRVLFLYTQWLALDTQLRATNAIRDDNVRLMNERKTERDALLQELAESREKAKVALEGLKRTQQDLFAIQTQLRDAQEALLVLEKELRRLELGTPDRTAGK